MKKLLIAFLSLAVLFNLVACKKTTVTVHIHDFNQEIISDETLKSEATCTNSKVYYKTCSCGFISEEDSNTFTYGDKLPHDYIENPESDYLVSQATLTERAVYYKSCSNCHQISTETFYYGDLVTVPENFDHDYFPTYITMSLYDTTDLEYGFCFDTVKNDSNIIIEYCKGEFDETKIETQVVVQEYSRSYNVGGTLLKYYVNKFSIKVEQNSMYSYRISYPIYEMYSDVNTFTSINPNTTKFTFVHVSDSQVDGGDSDENEISKTSAGFKNTLSQITDKTEFIIHTGDVVEYSRYEYYWQTMLIDNIDTFKKIPVQAISGNHETTYRNGTKETYKHFNNNIPSQGSIDKGYYYSFEYGNTLFIMLNTNLLASTNKLTDDQYKYIENLLKNNTCKWTIISMHNPMYSAGKYGSDPTRNAVSLSLRIQLLELFNHYNVDIVLQGHDHVTSKTHALNGSGEIANETFETINGIKYSVNPDGVFYTMDGASGTQTRGIDSNFKENDLYDYVIGSKSSTWSEITIDGNLLTYIVKHYDKNGAVVEYSWGIKKTD